MQLLHKLFGKKPKYIGITAISFTAEGIAIAVSQFSSTKKPKLIHCEFIVTNNKQSVLKDLTSKLQLEKYECYLVAAPDDYRSITIETPIVPANELAEAIRWKISDLIEFDIDDAIVEYYPMPESQRANSEKMMEIIASPKLTLQPLVDLCLNNDLDLKVIDIQETTLRNLASLLPENDQGIAVLHLQKTSGRLIIECHGSIYLNRKISIGYERLGLADNFLSDEQIAMEQSGLALEIQRSLDYVESFYGLPPIYELAVTPLSENTQGLLNILNNNHGITARIMDLSTIIDGDILLDDATQSHCAPVIGATLRSVVNTL